MVVKYMGGLTAADVGLQSGDYIQARGIPVPYMSTSIEIPACTVREPACARESSRRSVEPVMGGQRSARRQR